MSEENENLPTGQAGTGQEQPVKNTPEEIISSEQAARPETGEQPLNLKPLNDLNEPNPDMEVHHHTHAAHGKKNWRSYFWEFLMLFLAVFCGFLAEYQLEHVIENQREKKLMRSLIEDLKTDSTQLQTYIGWRTQTNRDFDSLLLLLAKPGDSPNAYFIYKLANRSALRFGLPDISERTIQQLKNAGGLRLIRSNAVSDAINVHYMAVNRLKSIYETEILIRIKLVDTRADILDAGLSMNTNAAPEAFNLITTEKIKINRFMNDILAAKQVNKGLMTQLDSARKSSTVLKELIEKEYQFK